MRGAEEEEKGPVEYKSETRYWKIVTFLTVVTVGTVVTVVTIVTIIALVTVVTLGTVVTTNMTKFLTKKAKMCARKILWQKGFFRQKKNVTNIASEKNEWQQYLWTTETVRRKFFVTKSVWTKFVKQKKSFSKEEERKKM